MTNLDAVREIYDAIERGDTDAVLAHYASDVEWDFSRSPFRPVVKQTVYRGHGEVRAFIRERYEEAWSEVSDQLDELSEVGDQVVSVVTSAGRGRVSGAEVAVTHAGLWSFRDGKVTRVAWFATADEALAAAGSGQTR